jgi:hypothetical protein
MAFLPEIGGLGKREKQLDRTGAVHLFTNDRFHVSDRPKTQWKVGIDTGSQLPDHPRPEHQLVAGDLRFRGDLLQGWKEISGISHGFFSCRLVSIKTPDFRL